MENGKKKPVVVIEEKSVRYFENMCNALVSSGYEFVSVGFPHRFTRVEDTSDPSITFTAVLINNNLLSSKKSNGALRVIAEGDKILFEDKCNKLINKGYKVSSSYSDVDDNNHTFYQAILVKE